MAERIRNASRMRLGPGTARGYIRLHEAVDRHVLEMFRFGE